MENNVESEIKSLRIQVKQLGKKVRKKKNQDQQWKEKNMMQKNYSK